MLVIVCRPGEQPTLEQSSLTLESLQSLVGGFVECVRLDRATDIWCDEEALLRADPTPNRLLPDGRMLHGTFVLAARSDNSTTGLSEADAARWLAEVTRWTAAQPVN